MRLGVTTSTSRQFGQVCRVDERLAGFAARKRKRRKTKTKEEALKTGNTTLKILRRKVQMQLGGLQPKGGVSLKGLVIRIALYRILVTVWYTHKTTTKCQT